jgi:hypothetical protein
MREAHVRLFGVHSTFGTPPAQLLSCSRPSRWPGVPHKLPFRIPRSEASSTPDGQNRHSNAHESRQGRHVKHHQVCGNHQGKGRGPYRGDDVVGPDEYRRIPELTGYLFTCILQRKRLANSDGYEHYQRNSPASTHNRTAGMDHAACTMRVYAAKPPKRRTVPTSNILSVLFRPTASRTSRPAEVIVALAKPP